MTERFNPVTSVMARARVRHYGGFVLAGLLAFATDFAILEALMRGAELSPYLARPIGISIAMFVSWIVNRSVTFAIRTRPSVTEFARFAAVSLSAQVVNYSVFAAVLAAALLTPFIALVIATAVSMLVSYSGFRFTVFGQSPHSLP